VSTCRKARNARLESPRDINAVTLSGCLLRQGLTRGFGDRFSLRWRRGRDPSGPNGGSLTPRGALRHLLRGWRRLLVAALWALGSPVFAAPKVRGVTVEGTAFRVPLDGGRVLPQEHLKGLILGLGDSSRRQWRIRIESVERDAGDPSGEVVLYGLGLLRADATACEGAGAALGVSARRAPAAS